MKNLSFADFAGIYCQYPLHTLSTYTIVRDIIKKKGFERLDVQDGSCLSLERYIVVVQNEDSSNRIIIPVMLDEVLDLNEMSRNLCVCSSLNVTLMLAIVSYDGIM